MRSSPYEQWMRVLRRNEQRGLAALPVLEQLAARDMWSHRGVGDRTVTTGVMRSLRPLASIRGRSPFVGDTSDIDGAIRLLQRHNKELRTRFGMNWAEVTHGVLGEATRRGASVTLVARTLCRSLAVRE